MPRQNTGSNAISPPEGGVTLPDSFQRGSLFMIPCPRSEMEGVNV